MTKTIHVLGFALALAGCASSSLPLSQLAPVPVERIQWKEAIPSSAGMLVIARDSGFSGSAAKVLVAIDGMAAADIRSGEVMRLQVEPGRRVITASAFAAVGGELRRPRSLEVTVRPGAETVVRIGFDEMGGGFSVWQDVVR